MIVFVLPLIIAAFWLTYFFMPPPRGLPILAYRGLADLCSDGISITSPQLNDHFTLIKDLGYQTIAFADLERFRRAIDRIDETVSWIEALRQHQGSIEEIHPTIREAA